MRRRPILLALAGLLTAAAGMSTITACGGTTYVIEGAEQVMLLTNLHPDARRRIYSVNYTSPPGGMLLPVCTPVTIDLVRDREIRFTVQSSGLQYRYLLHRSTRVPIDQHLQRYFGGQCPNVSGFGPEDQAGIAQGQIFQGMSKQGVIVAMGYPPEHRTPTLEGDVWRFWGNRHNSYEVYFSGGVVSGIRQ